MFSTSCGKLFALPFLVVVLTVIALVMVVFDNVICKAIGLAAMFLAIIMHRDVTDVLYNKWFFHRHIENSIQELQRKIQISQQQQQQPPWPDTYTNETEVTATQDRPKVVISLFIKREENNIWCGLVPSYRSYIDFFIPDQTKV